MAVKSVGNCKYVQDDKMKFHPIHSSSEGNLYIVEAENGKRLLLECGLSWKKIKKAVGYRIDNIKACLASHGHFDHCKSIETIIEAGINVYASKETLQKFGLYGHRLANELINMEAIFISDTFAILPFETHHDCEGSFGFIIRELETDESLLFATDTAYIEPRFTLPFSIIAIEASYQSDILDWCVEEKRIDQTQALRLRGSHMERSVALNYLREKCNLSMCREVHLLHCSKRALDKDSAIKEFKEKLFISNIR